MQRFSEALEKKAPGFHVLHRTEQRSGNIGRLTQRIVVQLRVSLRHLRAGMGEQLLQLVHGYLAGTCRPGSERMPPTA